MGHDGYTAPYLGIVMNQSLLGHKDSERGFKIIFEKHTPSISFLHVGLSMNIVINTTRTFFVSHKDLQLQEERKPFLNKMMCRTTVFQDFFKSIVRRFAAYSAVQFACISDICV